MTKLITGPMFSFKTSRLVHSMEKYLLAGKKILFFRPLKDDRGYVSHNDGIEKLFKNLKGEITTKEVTSYNDMESIIKDLYIDKSMIDVIFVDEYFMIKDCYKLAEEFGDKLPIIFAGLISDSNNILFPEAINLLPFIEYIEKENAICMECGEPASFSAYFGSPNRGEIEVGDNLYKCLCFSCYKKANKTIYKTR